MNDQRTRRGTGMLVVLGLSVLLLGVASADGSQQEVRP